jgi:hypothetical protein
MSSQEQPLEGQRAELESKLAALRVAPEVADLVIRADNAVQGVKAEAAALERAISELDREVGARARHEREEAERQRQEQLAAQRAQLVQLAEERAQAVADAEAGARQLAEALGRTLQVNATMARLTYELSGQTTPNGLNEFDLTSRLSMRLSALMVGIPRCRARFGGIQFPGSSRYAASESWSAAEEKLVAIAIQPILEGAN